MKKEKPENVRHALLHAERLASALRYERQDIVQEILTMAEKDKVLASMVDGILLASGMDRVRKVKEVS